MDLSYFEQFNEAHKTFVEKAFPNVTDFRGPFYHMNKEIVECKENGVLQEFADLQMLLLSAFRLKYPSLNTYNLIWICFSKLEKCKNRKWGEINEEGFVEHIE